MEILFCGARDLSLVSEALADVAREFGFTPSHFIDASIHTSQYAGWKENSKQSVREADVIVYVILEKYGEITWSTEYLEAINLGKQFIVLCDDRVFNYYNLSKHAGGRYIHEDDEKEKIFKVLDQLLAEQRTIVPFQLLQIGHRLREQLIRLLQSGIRLLEASAKHQTVLQAIDRDDEQELTKLTLSDSEKVFLVDVLLDVTKNLDHRKTILKFFTIQKHLETHQIISLISDPKIGIARLALDTLPLLAGPKSDTESVLDYAVDYSNTSQHKHLSRHLIPSVFLLDLKSSLFHLTKLFPIKDIAVPNAIMQWLASHTDKLKEVVNDDNDLEQLRELKRLCLARDPESRQLRENNDIINQALSIED